MTRHGSSAKRLDGKIAVVTGASAGIGLAVVQRFRAEGASVIGIDVDGENSGAVGDPQVHRRFDVSELDCWERLAFELETTGTDLDILVNNAGMVGTYDSITDVDIDTWHRVIATNQNGVFYGMRTMIPVLQRKGSGGSVVNVSSIWGLVGASGVAPYQASKGAVTMMTKNAALTCAPAKIRVNSVHPGLILTPMIARQDQEISNSVIEATPMKRAGKPDEVANAILFLASDEASYVTGAALTVDGGYTTP